MFYSHAAGSGFWIEARRRRRAPTRSSSSTPATSTGRLIAPTGTGRKLGFMARVSIAAKTPPFFTLGGDEAQAKMFSARAEVYRRARSLQGGHGQGDRGAGVVAQPRSLCGRRPWRGPRLSDEDAQGTARNRMRNSKPSTCARELELPIACNGAAIFWRTDREAPGLEDSVPIKELYEEPVRSFAIPAQCFLE